MQASSPSPIVVTVATGAGDVALAWFTALGSLAGFVALGLTVWQTRARRYLPDPALRALLESLIDDFNTIVSAGGRRTEWFLEQDRRGRELRLASLHGSVVDDNLNDHLTQVRGEWLTCWSLAGHPQQVDSQVESARKGGASASTAIDRFNTLMRKHGHYR